MLARLSDALERGDVEGAKAILNAWQLGMLHGRGYALVAMSAPRDLGYAGVEAPAHPPPVPD